MPENEEHYSLIELTSDIVAAYVSNNEVVAAELPDLIGDIYGALSKSADGSVDGHMPPLKPAVSPRKSINPDYLICLEDGKRFKSLKRHLRTHYDLSPEEYRQKWGLPTDYPMVAPNYAKARSELATQMGLGQSRTPRL